MCVLRLDWWVEQLYIAVLFDLSWSSWLCTMKEMLEGSVGPKQIVGHRVDDVVLLKVENGVVKVPEEAVVNSFMLSADRQAVVVMKSRPYTDKDGMLVVSGLETNETPFVETVEDLHPSELARLLQIAEKASAVGAGENDSRFISINSHRSDSYGYGELPFNVRAQTLRNLHVHFGVVEQSAIHPLTRELTKRERDDINDPMIRIVERLLSIPSVKNALFAGLAFDFLGVRHGNIQLGSVDISNDCVAGDLIILHKRLRELYGSVNSCFWDGSNLLTSEIRAEKINSWFDQMKDENGDDDTHSEQTIEKLKRFFLWLNQHLSEVPRDGHRIFLRGYASTTVFVRGVTDQSWQLMIAPRVISTGNALHAMGLVKNVVEPSAEFRKMRQAYVEQLRQLVV